MSPVSVQATLTQQVAEALAGIALVQLIRPGAPVIFGSFLSNNDMQSGAPAFGTPESAVGLLCTGQIARHYGLPFRSGGGLTASTTGDAQAAYEALMTMLPTFLAGTNWVMHSAGWLESGLVAVLREVHRRHRDPADDAARSSRRSRSTRSRSRGTPTRRSATAATSSARRTPSSTSATASTGRCCPRPRTSSAGSASAAGRHRPRREDLARDGRQLRAPPLDDAIAPGAGRVRHAAAARARGLRFTQTRRRSRARRRRTGSAPGCRRR